MNKIIYVLYILKYIVADINHQKKIIINNIILNEKNKIENSINKINQTIIKLKSNKDKISNEYSKNLNHLNKLNNIQLKEFIKDISNTILKDLPNIFNIKTQIRLLKLQSEKLIFLNDKVKIQSLKTKIKKEIVSFLSNIFNKYYEKNISELIKNYNINQNKTNNIKVLIFTNLVNHYLKKFRNLKKINKKNLDASIKLINLSSRYCKKNSKISDIECELKLYKYALDKTIVEMEKINYRSYKKNEKLNYLLESAIDEKHNKLKSFNKYNNQEIKKIKKNIDILKYDIKKQKSSLNNIKNQKNLIIKNDLNNLTNSGVKLTN